MESNAVDLCARTDEPQLVCTVVEDVDIFDYVVIDSTVSGRACGGLDMVWNVDEAEVRGLVRGDRGVWQGRW